MRIAVDTNVYVKFCRGEADIVKVIKMAEQIFLPLVVLAELRAGFACGQKTVQNEKSLVYFLNSPRVHVLNPDEQTSHHYAQLYYQLRKQGTPIPTNDVWIAALVHQHNLSLLTRDKHFDNLPQLLRV